MLLVLNILIFNVCKWFFEVFDVVIVFLILFFIEVNLLIK